MYTYINSFFSSFFISLSISLYVFFHAKRMYIESLWVNISSKIDCVSFIVRRYFSLFSHNEKWLCGHCMPNRYTAFFPFSKSLFTEQRSLSRGGIEPSCIFTSVQIYICPFSIYQRKLLCATSCFCYYFWLFLFVFFFI